MATGETSSQVVHRGGSSVCSWAVCAWGWGWGTHVEHVVEEHSPEAHALAVAHHVEIKHAERFHLVHHLFIVE